MRISDWSSDVCSSDLLRDADEAGCDAVILEREQRVVPRQRADDAEQPPEMDQRPQHDNASERRRPGRLVLHRARLRRTTSRPARNGMASDPPGRMQGRDAAAQVAILHLGESRRRDTAGARLLIGEAADAFDEITIGVAVAGADRAERRPT